MFSGSSVLAGSNVATPLPPTGVVSNPIVGTVGEANGVEYSFDTMFALPARPWRRAKKSRFSRALRSGERAISWGKRHR